LKYEPYFISAITVYVILSYLGRRRNSQISSSFISKSYSFLGTQFAFTGTGTTERNFWKAGGDGIEKDPDSKRRWFGWATGRRGCDGVEIRVECESRDDLLGWLYQVSFYLIV
jgi:hypothetical protein